MADTSAAAAQSVVALLNAPQSGAARADPDDDARLRGALAALEDQIRSGLSPGDQAIAMKVLAMLEEEARAYQRQPLADAWRRNATASRPRSSLGGAWFWTELDRLLSEPVPRGPLIALFRACVAGGYPHSEGVSTDGSWTRTGVLASIDMVLDPGATVSSHGTGHEGLAPGPPPAPRRALIVSLVLVGVASLVAAALAWRMLPPPAKAPPAAVAVVAPRPAAVLTTAEVKPASAPTDPKSLAATYAELTMPRCQSLTANRYPFFQSSHEDAAAADVAALFGVNGALANLAESLLPRMDTEGGAWRWRTGDAAATVLQPYSAEQLQKAAAIRGLLAEGLSLEVDQAELGVAATQAELEISGVRQVFAQAAGSPTRYHWSLDGVQDARLTIQVGDEPRTLEFGGPWALFRLMDLARKTQDPQDPAAFRATFGEGAATVTFRIRTPGGAEAFRRGGPWSFRCPSPL